MTQDITVSSPCVRNCCLDDDDVCVGCFRTVEEIVEWGEASEQRRGDILKIAEKRKQQKGPGFGRI